MMRGQRKVRELEKVKEEKGRERKGKGERDEERAS